jgi:hypothetical protein
MTEIKIAVAAANEAEMTAGDACSTTSPTAQQISETL